MVGIYLLTESSVYKPLRHFVVIASDVSSRTFSFDRLRQRKTFYFDSKHLEFFTFDLIRHFIAFANSTHIPGEQFLPFLY